MNKCGKRLIQLCGDQGQSGYKIKWVMLTLLWCMKNEDIILIIQSRYYTLYTIELQLDTDGQGQMTGDR